MPTSEPTPLPTQLEATAPPPNWFRGFIQGKTRIVAAWLFAIWLGFTAREYPQWPGIVICFAGAALRYWASGFLRKDSRPAVGGPYAWVRNPLYLGTYLMAVGTAASIENWGLLVVLSVLYAILYHYIILDEETKLRRIFGEPYAQYLVAVPRFFPRLFPPGPAPRDVRLNINPDASHLEFSKELAAKNKAYEAFATFAALIALVAGVAWAWQHFGGAGTGTGAGF